MELMIVEKRFAFIVEHIEKSDFEEVREVLFEAGKEISINENYHNCIELFKVINNYLKNTVKTPFFNISCVLLQKEQYRRGFLH